MSKVKVDEIVHTDEASPVDFPDGLTSGGAPVGGGSVRTYRETAVDTTAVVNELLYITNPAGKTITPPANPEIGDEVYIKLIIDAGSNYDFGTYIGQPATDTPTIYIWNGTIWNQF